MPRRLFRALGLVCALVWTACTSAANDAHANDPTGDTAAPDAPKKPKNAHEIATNLISGQIGAFIYMDKVRNTPTGERILKIPMVADELEGTGLDPEKDLERVYIASPDSQSRRAIVFGEHNLDAAGAHKALQTVLAKSDPPGEMIPAEGFEAVKVTIKKQTGVVAMLPPNYLVVVPEDLVDHIRDFEATGGLPLHDGPEAVIAMAQNPGQTVRLPRLPRIPETITKGGMTILLKPEGGAVVDFAGEDANAEKAIEDAEVITDNFNRATSVQIAILSFRLFDPIKFQAEGTTIKGRLALSQDEVDKLASIAQTFAP
ncbi:MAG: hypothetical protein U0414_04250 [Polyangiaceae bacterium]